MEEKVAEELDTGGDILDATDAVVLQNLVEEGNKSPSKQGIAEVSISFFKVDI